MGIFVQEPIISSDLVMLKTDMNEVFKLDLFRY